MTKPKQGHDPHQAREAERYERPVASREHILSVLRSQKRPLSLKKLSKHFDYHTAEDKEALRRRVMAMLRGGQLTKDDNGDFQATMDQQLMEATIVAGVDGGGRAFLVDDKDAEPIRVPDALMALCFHGDIVPVRQHRINKKKPWQYALVAPKPAIDRAVHGQITMHGTQHVITMFGRNASKAIAIENESDYPVGSWVAATLTEFDWQNRQYSAFISGVIGDHDSLTAGVSAIAMDAGIHLEWPEAVSANLHTVPDTVRQSDIEGRSDHRHLPFVTIDGETAKDFDDAIYTERTPSGWRLYVAIADVSSYVQTDTELDKEARHRGTSIYLADRVIPMLPETLSNGICSLVPNQDRLALMAIMDYDVQGTCTKCWFEQTVIKSHARLTYNEVMSMIDGKTMPADWWAAAFEAVTSLADLLMVKRKKRLAVPFDTAEVVPVIDHEKGKVEGFQRVTLNKAHQLIEACMLEANEQAAKFCQKMNLPVLYRIHEEPKDADIKALSVQLKRAGVKADITRKTLHENMGHWLGLIRERADFEWLQLACLQTMQQAKYSVDGLGHFGLALDDYLHFTSPIRRYPDLVVHRAIAAKINRQSKQRTDSREALVPLSTHLTQMEKRAEGVSRRVTSWLQCLYLKSHVNQTFDGTVMAVKSFGCFVRLDGCYAEGLLPVRDLPGGYYHYDEVSQTLTESKSKQQFTAGMRVVIRLIGVDETRQFIDLQFIKPLK